MAAAAAATARFLPPLADTGGEDAPAPAAAAVLDDRPRFRVLLGGVGVVVVMFRCGVLWCGGAVISVWLWLAPQRRMHWTKNALDDRTPFVVF